MTERTGRPTFSGSGAYDLVVSAGPAGEASASAGPDPAFAGEVLAADTMMIAAGGGSLVVSCPAATHLAEQCFSLIAHPVHLRQVNADGRPFAGLLPATPKFVHPGAGQPSFQLEDRYSGAVIFCDL